MIHQIRPSGLAQWLQSRADGPAPVVLDVREPYELGMARVAPEGMELLAIPMASIPRRLHELDPARPIACLCHHGSRSMQVAQFLHHHGYADVANISGGIDAWALELDPSLARY